MRAYKTEVTYIYKDDLVSSEQDIPIEKIGYMHLKNRDIWYKANVLILKINGDYRVIRSRY